VTLLYTNDIESKYSPVEAFWNEGIENIGGIPQLASLIDKERATEGVTFLLDAGDIFTGSLSKATQGKLAFDIYSAMGYDAITLGNHEFEYGWEVLKDVMQRARFPVLNANIFYEGTDINIARQYTILERGGVRIGVIGIIGVDAFINASMKANRKNLEVREPTAIVQRLVDRLRPEVDMVVVLTHQNRTAPMQTDKEADPTVQRGYAEDYALAGNVQGIDMLIGGHSDNGLWEPVRHPDTGTLVGMTFGQGKYLGYAKFEVEDGKPGATLIEGKLIPVVSDNLYPHPEVVRLINAARRSNPGLAQVIGQLDKPAIRRYYREANMGNLIADILRDATGADVGMLSSGSIRSDLPSGQLSVEALIDVFPFTDKIAVVELNGTDLIHMFEHSFSLAYGLAQVSGAEVQYNSSKPSGERLVRLSIGGRPVDKTAIYRLATGAYQATGGDEFSMLARNPGSTSDLTVATALVEYFRKTATIRVPDLGRQVDIAAHSTKETGVSDVSP
jgi:2',3'-cyclic-nucleotide 2'-phosphodiesterase (5'-nucleotidase family)